MIKYHKQEKILQKKKTIDVKHDVKCHILKTFNLYVKSILTLRIVWSISRTGQKGRWISSLVKCVTITIVNSSNIFYYIIIVNLLSCILSYTRFLKIFSLRFSFLFPYNSYINLEIHKLHTMKTKSLFKINL